MMPKPTLLKKNIFITNPSDYEFKVGNLLEQGASNLHLISDFDRTLTHGFRDGQKSSTSFGMIRESGVLGKKYSAITQVFFEYYYPIEVNPQISFEEKCHKMEEWWSKALAEMIRHGLSKEIIHQLIERGKYDLRTGADELLNMLHQHNIPVLIFSAGLGDLISSHLHQNNSLHPNMHLISNFLKFDDDGIMTGYKKPIIHSLSKREHLTQGDHYHQQVAHKANVILMGDIIEDAQMADSISHQNVLKIGFLNSDIERRMNDFANHFDVIITQDTSTSFVNDLISQILEVSVSED